jgi:hypothetical protein
MKEVLPFEFRHPDVDKIINEVSEYMNIPFQDIIGKRRMDEIVKARHTCYHLIKAFVEGISLKRIGYHFTKADHSSVIHGLSNVDIWLDKDQLYACKMYDLKLTIRKNLQLCIVTDYLLNSEFIEEESYLTPDESTFEFLNLRGNEVKNQL